MLLYGSLDFMSFGIMTGAIDVVNFSRYIFAPESAIASVFLLGEFGEFSIQFIKLIVGSLISILLIITLKRLLHPLLLPPSRLF